VNHQITTDPPSYQNNRSSISLVVEIYSFAYLCSNRVRRRRGKVRGEEPTTIETKIRSRCRFVKHLSRADRVAVVVSLSPQVQACPRPIRASCSSSLTKFVAGLAPSPPLIDLAFCFEYMRSSHFSQLLVCPGMPKLRAP
jgi:hypothetical protein